MKMSEAIPTLPGGKVQKVPASDAAGVEPFSIEGPMHSRRRRLTVGMTDEDRAWRRQWLRDQVLAESEPIEIPGMYEARNNPLRRAMAYPGNLLFRPIYNKYGYWQGRFVHKLCSGAMFALFTFWAASYYMKYNSKRWDKLRGWECYGNKPTLLPGDPGFGQRMPRKPQDFANDGFDQSPLYK